MDTATKMSLLRLAVGLTILGLVVILVDIRDRQVYEAKLKLFEECQTSQTDEGQGACMKLANGVFLRG